MEKAILLIDDGKEQKQVLQNIKTQLFNNESINLTTKYINPNDREYWDENKDPDIDKLIGGIIKGLVSIKPNLVVVDQYYSDNDKFKGLDVIAKLRGISKFKKCSFFLISGKRDAIVRDIFTTTSIPVNQKVNLLAKIIGLKIDSFLDKNFKDEAIGILKKSSLDEILPSKLRNYEDENAVINQFSPKYNTLTFSELADKIEESHADVSNILDEIFELTLSHYVHINEKLQ